MGVCMCTQRESSFINKCNLITYSSKDLMCNSLKLIVGMINAGISILAKFCHITLILRAFFMDPAEQTSLKLLSSLATCWLLSQCLYKQLFQAFGWGKSENSLQTMIFSRWFHISCHPTWFGIIHTDEAFKAGAEHIK